MECLWKFAKPVCLFQLVEPKYHSRFYPVRGCGFTITDAGVCNEEGATFHKPGVDTYPNFEAAEQSSPLQVQTTVLSMERRHCVA